MGSLPQVAVLCGLQLSKLSSNAALYHETPPSGAALHGWQLPSSPPPQRAALQGCSSSQGAPAGVSVSSPSFRPHPLLGCREQASALCLELLLPSFYTDFWGCRAVSLLFLTPLSQLLLYRFSLPSIHAPRGAPSVAHGSALPSSRSLWELLCHSCSPHYQNLAT